jgi:diguanylate cyclase (GGDEF)-like protein
MVSMISAQIETETYSYRGFKQRVIEILLVAALYFISARVGQIFAIPPGNVTPVWLPSGIMVALALIRGAGIWPGIFLGAFLGNAWAYFSLDSFSAAMSAIIAGTCNGIGDVLSTVGAVLLLSFISKKPNILNDYRDFTLFVILAVILGPAVSALFGVSSLALMGFLPWSDYTSVLITWWTGDGVGALLLAPLILSWYEKYTKKTLQPAVWKTFILIGGGTFLACILFGMIEVPYWLFLLSYAAAPILLITSLYLGQANCFSALIALTSVAVLATSVSIGPFSSSSQNLNLLALQLFIGVMSYVVCLLSITIRQRLEVEARAKETANSLAQAQQIANLGSWEMNLTSNKLTWSDQVFRIFEIDPSKSQASYEEFLNTIHPDDRDYVNQAYTDSLVNKKPYEIEHRLMMSDGRIKYVSERCESTFDECGSLIWSIGTVQDITEKKLADQKILHQAHYDALTNLPNRLLSLDRLSQLLHEADRDNTKVAVLFLDLDHFKNVNDSLGHDVGDNLLVEVGKRLKESVRAGDTVGRLGGDEFLILLRGLHNSDEVTIAVEHLLVLFKSPFILSGHEINISSSLGIVMYPGGGQTSTEVLRNADLAMYRSKELGRNKFSFFSSEMNEHISRSLTINEQLRRALEREEFQVHYQIQIDVNTGKIISAEALLRWHNYKLGPVGPDEFIPIAEQTGLIVQIGQFVLNKALKVISTAINSGNSDLVIAVNLSPKQFTDPNLLTSIKLEIRRFDVPPNSLELEITEGVLMSGYSNVDQMLQGIHDIGVKISLDDFGTGYSSLSYLRSYPFDALKIDRSFIADIQVHDGKELVNAAIGMAHALNLKVVAEGVETEEQLAILKELGCDLAQGYLFSKPVCEEEFLALIDGQF